jgi:galactokinase/mevalonate kinase-like predicted kinase
MAIELSERLKAAFAANLLPTVVVYNRLDGPGSSLDLREFQQALWSLRPLPEDILADPAMKWSEGFPRTVSMTINTGTKVQGVPFEHGEIAVRSVEYHTEVSARTGAVVPTKANWLLKILDIFSLSGVMFLLHNLRPGIQSSGLGGSASAATGVCILANELAGRPFGPTQLIALASRIEQDLGVSITGTQEQASVLFGGVADYVWFPWGIPGRPETGYASSIRTPLLEPQDYAELEKRIAVFHSGRPRASTDVNSVWVGRLLQEDGLALHKRKPAIAYRFREALRLRRWDEVHETIQNYRDLRTHLCPPYMDGAHELLGFAEARGCTIFPLGAGGGGAVMAFGTKADALQLLRTDLAGVYREIPFSFRAEGHQLINLPLQ